MRRSAFAAKHATKSASFNCNKISLSVEASSKASCLFRLITDRSFVFTKVNLEKPRSTEAVVTGSVNSTLYKKRKSVHEGEGVFVCL